MEINIRSIKYALWFRNMVFSFGCSEEIGFFKTPLQILKGQNTFSIKTHYV